MNIAKRLLLVPLHGLNQVQLYRQSQGIWYSMLAQEEKPVESSILQKLTEQLRPSHIEVINESYMHSVPKGSETHFKVLVVSDSFESQPLIKRHRMVNSILEEELSSGVHALSIVAKTPKQWQESDMVVKPSPKCEGGFGS